MILHSEINISSSSVNCSVCIFANQKAPFDLKNNHKIGVLCCAARPACFINRGIESISLALFPCFPQNYFSRSTKIEQRKWRMLVFCRKRRRTLVAMNLDTTLGIYDTDIYCVMVWSLCINKWMKTLFHGTHGTAWQEAWENKLHGVSQGSYCVFRSNLIFEISLRAEETRILLVNFTAFLAKSVLQHVILYFLLVELKEVGHFDLQ